MRKYILPALIALALSGAFAVSQTINRAVQLSQDVTGAFSVDTNNGVYFPGHVLFSTTRTVPPPTMAGTSSPTVIGSDFAGTVTFGAGQTTATMTFGQAYLTIPTCVVTQSPSTTSSLSYTIATGTLALTLSAGGTPASKANYFCSSAS